MAFPVHNWVLGSKLKAFRDASLARLSPPWVRETFDLKTVFATLTSKADMSLSVRQDTLFSLLPAAKAPWTEFGFSTVLQALAVGFFVWARLLYPNVVTAPEHSFRSIQLVDHPIPVNHRPQAQVRLKPELTAELTAPTEALRLPAAKPPVQREAERAPAVTVAERKMEALPLNEAPLMPKQGVKMNVFSTGSSATPTTARAASQVQTGGFGDPNGVAAQAHQGSAAVNIAAAGSFDLPSGAGYGNGTGGAKGVAGVVASAGFGNGSAVGVSRQRAATVQQGAFGDADVAAAPTVRSRPAEAARAIPAEITSKPTPAYTQEARSLKIEGEVLLEVILQASGNPRVLRVVRGLGHGLDDNAVKAAEQIHFKPAVRDGQPTDSTVILHIIFQLA